MNPKYLQVERVGETGLTGKQAQGSGTCMPSPPPQNPVATSSHGPCSELGLIPIQLLLLHKATVLGSRGKGSPQDQDAGKPPLPLPSPAAPREQEGSEASLLPLRATLHCLTTHLLFFGWYPQKEMFFSWKKWLHLFTWGRERRTIKAFLPTAPVGQLVSVPWK